MDCVMTDDHNDLEDLVERARLGDRAAMEAIFSWHRGALKAMVQLHLDRRLQGRIDPSDVLQDAYVDALRMLPEYLAAPRAPLVPLEASTAVNGSEQRSSGTPGSGGASNRRTG
jgi:hypothetical protein